MLAVEKYNNADGGGSPEKLAAVEDYEKPSNIFFLDYRIIPRRRRTPRIDVTDEYLRRDNLAFRRCRKSSEDGEKRKRKTTKATIQELLIGLEPPPGMPEVFKNFIKELGGNDIRIVIQKIIYRTDINPIHNRFPMIVSRLRSRFLNQAEELVVIKREPLRVKLVEPCLRESEINMTMWTSGRKTEMYVFITEWNEVVRNNSDMLKEKAVVQVWSFRLGAESKLGFAMVKVRDGYDC